MERSLSATNASSPPSRSSTNGTATLGRGQMSNSVPASVKRSSRHRKAASLDLDALFEKEKVAASSQQPKLLKRASSRIFRREPVDSFIDVAAGSPPLLPDPNAQQGALFSSAQSPPMRSAQSDSSDVLPKRFTGWLSNMLHPTSTNDLRALASSTTSPNSGRNPLGLVDRRWFDKAANYLFDVDANVDRCPDDIWLLGVCHQGWRPTEAAPLQSPGSQVATNDPFTSTLSPGANRANKKTRLKSLATSPASKRKSKRASQADISPVLGSVSAPFINLSPSSPERVASRSKPSLSPQSSLDSTSTYYTQSTKSLSSTLDVCLPTESRKGKEVARLPSLDQTNGWPPTFFLDFMSRIQLTYRTGFPPILNLDGSGTARPSTGLNGFKEMMGSLASSIGRREASAASISSAAGGQGLSSDVGWGCMLRTGQTLLANALATHHLGRDWRRNLPTLAADGSTQQQPPLEYGKYARLLSWFMDTPSALAPFSVHRFALEGKVLGKEVGQWFGPSTAAGAIAALTQVFPAAGLGVLNAVDGSVYLSDVVEASQKWTRPVLVLLNLRLGISGVNPIYHASIKTFFSFPQCCGISGGRPSSSYYFVGSQADSLFYYDPHYPKPATPVRLPTDEILIQAALNLPLSSPPQDNEEWETLQPVQIEEDAFVEHGEADESWSDAGDTRQDALDRRRLSAQSQQKPFPATEADSTNAQARLDTFFSSAYPPTDLLSFHADRVRKIALSGLDPSMLLGFLIRDEADMRDWQERSSNLKPALYSVAEDVPEWARRSVPSRSVSVEQSAAVRSPNLSVDPVDSDWDISDTESGFPDDVQCRSTTPLSDPDQLDRPQLYSSQS